MDAPFGRKLSARCRKPFPLRVPAPNFTPAAGQHKIEASLVLLVLLYETLPENAFDHGAPALGHRVRREHR